MTTSATDHSADQPFHLTGNYAPVDDETTHLDLQVTGQIPADLDGVYLRNGPNPRTPSAHWFIGDGMIHGVRLRDGQAAGYRNRWVRTDSFDTPIPLYDPATGARNLNSSVANTHVVRHAGKLLALVESSLPYQITAELETVGAYDFGGRLHDSMTAHPKICPRTGELHFFGYGSLFAPYVTYHRADAGGALVVEQPVDVPALTMMHDFAITADWVLFLDLPVVFDLQLARAGGMPFRWDDEYGARIGLMRRDDPSHPVRWVDIEPCYVFHVVNAFQADHGDEVVLHAVRYPQLWRDSNTGFDIPGNLWEWRLDPVTGRVRERQVDDLGCEFPRIDDRHTGTATTAAYLVTTGGILHYQGDTWTSQVHQFTDGATTGEACYVPSSDGRGYLMAYVYRPGTNTSDLVILDASEVAAEPLAIVHLPVRVPNGFHGDWFRTEIGVGP